MYVGKMTQRPLFCSISKGFCSSIILSILHNTVEEKDGEPVIVTDALKVGKVLVEI
jgi:hypothetical protein